MWELVATAAAGLNAGAGLQAAIAGAPGAAADASGFQRFAGRSRMLGLLLSTVATTSCLTAYYGGGRGEPGPPRAKAAVAFEHAPPSSSPFCRDATWPGCVGTYGWASHLRMASRAQAPHVIRQGPSLPAPPWLLRLVPACGRVAWRAVAGGRRGRRHRHPLQPAAHEPAGCCADRRRWAGAIQSVRICPCWPRLPPSLAQHATTWLCRHVCLWCA